MRNSAAFKAHSTTSFSTLKNPKRTGIVRCRKDGTKRMYSIVDPRIHNVIDDLTPETCQRTTKEGIDQMT